MGGVVLLILFLLMLGGFYFYHRREQAEYDGLGDVMTGEEPDQVDEPDEQPLNIDPEKDLDPEDKPDAGTLLWSGTMEGTTVRIIRGENYRDSNRSITIHMEATCPVGFRLEPSNPLRRLSRKMEELLSSRRAVDLPGPLEELLIYTEEKDDLKEFLRPWNQPEQVEELADFHHVRGNESGLKARFYQFEVDQNEIKRRAQTLARLGSRLPFEEAEE